MTKKRFGSSSFLFLTAVLGMAGSAAASAAGNSGERKVTTEDGSLVKNDLDNLGNNLVEAKVNLEKILKLMALGLGITTGAVTIGGTAYYFKDAENRQKFLQAISERFGKGKPGEAEIDKTIEIAEKTEEELKKDQVDEKNDENKATDQIVPGNADDNSNKGEIHTDVPENSAEKVSEGNAFSNAVHDKVYGLTRDKIMSILPIIKKRLALSKASEEDLKLIDRYVFFLGKNAFGGQTSFAVFKLLHLVLVLYNLVITFCYVYTEGEFKGAFGEVQGASGGLEKLKKSYKFIKPVLRLLGRLVLDFSGIVSPVVSVAELAYPHVRPYAQIITRKIAQRTRDVFGSDNEAGAAHEEPEVGP